MRKHPRTRARWLLLATLGAFAALVPSAGADTTLPVWTCRASAAYVELDPLLGTRRVEPVLANGFPDRANPDTGLCASSDTGAQDVNIPGGTATEPTLTLNAAFATTRITPEIAFARDQTVFASGGVVEPLRIQVGALTIEAEAVTAEARGSCVGTTPTLTGRSQILTLRVNDQEIEIPDNGQPVDLNLSPLIRVRLNEQVRTGTAATADESLTQRAVHIEVLPIAGAAQPLTRVVIGEAKVDRHGAVCAPPPPPPVCPVGSTAQNPGGNPLICVLPVTAPCPEGSSPDPNAGGACVIIRQVPAPCPAGSTPDPNAGGACVIIRQAPAADCAAGTIRDPATNNCVLVRDRPCPPGSRPDPATRVCVAVVVQNVGSGNGRIGDRSGPVARCGRLSMRFVRGGGRRLTSRFGTRVVTRGRLVTCGRNPRSIVGARIDVVHVLPDGRRLRKTGMRSRGGGRLTLILPMDLRTRRIEYAYRPDLASTRVTSRVTLRLTVRDRRGRVLR
jgi:hypothetical protein